MDAFSDSTTHPRQTVYARALRQSHQEPVSSPDAGLCSKRCLKSTHCWHLRRTPRLRKRKVHLW
jgi:hypothetical protein